MTDTHTALYISDTTANSFIVPPNTEANIGIQPIKIPEQNNVGEFEFPKQEIVGAVIETTSEEKQKSVIQALQSSYRNPNIIIYAPTSSEQLCRELRSEHIVHVSMDNAANPDKEITLYLKAFLREMEQREVCHAEDQNEFTTLRAIYQHSLFSCNEAEIESKLSEYTNILRENFVFDACLVTKNSISDPEKEEVIAADSERYSIKQGDIISFPEVLDLDIEADSLVNVHTSAPNKTVIESVGHVGTHIITPIIKDGTKYGHLHLIRDVETRYPIKSKVQAIINISSYIIGQEIQNHDTQKTLRRKLDKLKEFKQIISHDLISPLGTAKGRAEIAKDKHDCDHCERCYKSIERMENMIEGTQRLLKAGEVTQTEELEIKNIGQDCWDVLDANSASLQVVDHFTIHADKDQLKTVLENLFKNAIEHGGVNTTIRIRKPSKIHTTTRVDPHDSFTFYVEDNGPGIPKENQGNVFDSGHTTKETDTPSGLGLSIVKMVVEAHGWDIHVDENYTDGARFVISNVN